MEGFGAIDASQRPGKRFGAVVATPWLPQLTSGGPNKRPAGEGEPWESENLPTTSGGYKTPPQTVRLSTYRAE